MGRIETNLRYIRQTAEQLEKGVQLTPEQMQFWGRVLRRISEGIAPDVALNIKRRRGEKEENDSRRKKISKVMHLIAALHIPFDDPRFPSPKKHTLEQAINMVLPEVSKIMGDEHKYDLEVVRNWWYDCDKKDLRSPLRNHLSPNTTIK